MSPVLVLSLAAVAPRAPARPGPIAPTAAARDPRFAVMTHFAQGWDPSLAAAIAEAGGGQVRDEIYWDSVEPQPGQFAFPPQFDAYMDALRARRISPLVILDFENHNYDGGNTPYTPQGMAGYARYATQVLAHYGSQIHAVEVWNEYNGSFCTGPATNARADTYARMLAGTYAAIKQTRPDVTVVAGATAGTPLPYWEKLMQDGALKNMDVLSVHPYRYNSAPEGIEQDIEALQRLVKQYNGGRTKPIWVTEIGWETQAAAAPGALAIDEQTQAKFLVRAYALLLSAHVARIYWYMLRDDPGVPMGLVDNDAAVTRKPAYGAWRTMLQQLSGARFVRREKTPDNLYSMLFLRGNEEQRVLWALHPATVAADGAVAGVDLRGQPVDVSAPLTLNDAPIFVEGPLRGLPPPPPATETVIADSVTGFSSVQGKNGWQYGSSQDGDATFAPLPTFQVTDWTEDWTGVYPFISISSGDQHPSVNGQTPVAVIRRWVSDRAASVHIAGSFQCGTQGDGVGVSILVGGQRQFRTLLGGGASIVQNFDFHAAVRPGTPIDFAVDPGPGEDINYDATTLTAKIALPLNP